jgi:alkylhydroperoxidase family enzyme
LFGDPGSLTKEKKQHEHCHRYTFRTIDVPDAKLSALVTLVKELVRERGYAKDETIQKFLAAGYKKEQVMELLLGIALKTISNYVDHISPTPVDPAFATESK